MDIKDIYLIKLFYKLIIVVLVFIIIVLLYCLHQVQGDKPLFSGTILENISKKISNKSDCVINKIYNKTEHIINEEMKKRKKTYEKVRDEAQRKSKIKIKKLEQNMPKRRDDESLAALGDYIGLWNQSAQITQTENSNQFYEEQQKRRT